MNEIVKSKQVKRLLKQKTKIETKLDKLLCRQCGECCHEIDNSTDPPTILPTYCEQLKWIGTKAYCKLYPFHHGYVLKCGGLCVPIQMVETRSPNCLYNQIYGKPISEIKEDIKNVEAKGHGDYE